MVDRFTSLEEIISIINHGHKDSEIQFICSLINGPTDPEHLIEQLEFCAWTKEQIIEGCQRALERGYIWINSGGYVELIKR